MIYTFMPQVWARICFLASNKAHFRQILPLLPCRRFGDVPGVMFPPRHLTILPLSLYNIEDFPEACNIATHRFRMRSTPESRAQGISFLMSRLAATVSTLSSLYSIQMFSK